MKRIIYQEVGAWAKKYRWKPLILRGARQVGKTHVVRERGKTFKNFVEINFEKVSSAREIFKKDLNPERKDERVFY